ncbi:MAG TPA: hypothetical protein VH572_02420 [Gaiella sp.]|jgi:hypothetical protein
MAKRQSAKIADTLETLRPYLDRALTDPEFRKDVRDALEAARELYEPIAKGNGGVTKKAKKLAGNKKAQANLKRALDDLQSATTTLKGKKRKRRGRKTLLLAGVVAGALYNPWTGPQTRDWLVGKVAGDDGLEPLEGFDMPAAEEAVAEEAAAEAPASEKDAKAKSE